MPALAAWVTRYPRVGSNSGITLCRTPRGPTPRPPYNQGNRIKQTDPQRPLAPSPTTLSYRHCEARSAVAIHGDAPRLPLDTTPAAQHGSPRPVGARDDAVLALFCFMRLPRPIGARDDAASQFLVSCDYPPTSHQITLLQPLDQRVQFLMPAAPDEANLMLFKGVSQGVELGLGEHFFGHRKQHCVFAFDMTAQGL